MEIDLVKGGLCRDKNQDELWERFAGNWRDRCVFELLEEGHYASEPRNIASALKVSLEEVYESLDLLTAIGVIKKDIHGTFKKTVRSINFQTKNLSKSVELKNYAMLTADIVRRLSTDGPCQYVTNTVFTDEDALKEFLQEYKKLRQRFEEKSASKNDKKKILVAYQFAISSMTEEGGLS